jgi:hypothetical protein
MSLTQMSAETPPMVTPETAGAVALVRQKVNVPMISRSAEASPRGSLE